MKPKHARKKSRRAKHVSPLLCLLQALDSLNRIRALALVVGEACAHSDQEQDAALAVTVSEFLVGPLDETAAEMSAALKALRPAKRRAA
jgi:hypothetical protein